MIRKRSEHGLGHLVNPLDPDRDDRDWITPAIELLIYKPELISTGGGPPWLDLPAVTRFAFSTNDLRRAFETYNATRPWSEQVKPFNFLLHAHIHPSGYPAGVDPARFRLLAPYEAKPSHWLELPWTNLHTGQQHPVTTDPHDHRADVVGLKTYRDVLALYAIHPEPKSLDPDGHPCTRRSPPGLLQRRPITVLTISLIGSESNRLDETTAGLIGTLDDALATYSGPTENAWTTLVLPTLPDFSNHELAALAGLDTRTLQRIKSRAITAPHQRNRTVLTLIAAKLAAERLDTWGITPPATPLEQLAAYLDCREGHQEARRCIVCDSDLTGRQRLYCSNDCKWEHAYWRRRGSQIAASK